jgi:hypothetical protein
MQAGRQAQAKSVLSEVQTRHSDIKHIEKTIVVCLYISEIECLVYLTSSLLSLLGITSIIYGYANDGRATRRNFEQC